eukprot:2564807-Karenia_brevis.AAC.1
MPELADVLLESSDEEEVGAFALAWSAWDKESWQSVRTAFDELLQKCTANQVPPKATLNKLFEQ